MKIQLKKLLSNQELKSELIAQKAELKNLSEKVAAHIPNKRLNLMLVAIAVLNLITLVVVLVS